MWYKVLVIAIVAALAGSALAQFPSIDGTWEWVSTEYESGAIDTPASVGYSEQFYFGPNVLFIRYVDEQHVSESEWDVAEVLVGSCFIFVLGCSEGNWAWWIDEGDVRTLHLVAGYQCPPGNGTPPSETRIYVSRVAVAVDSTSWGSVKSLYR